MKFHYELLEETRKEIKNMCFFREEVEINAEEYEIIHDYNKALENAFHRFYEYGGFGGQTWVDILEENMAKVRKIIYQHDNYAELSEVLRRIEISELDDLEYTIDDDYVQEEIYNEIKLCAKSRFVC